MCGSVRQLASRFKNAFIHQFIIIVKAKNE